MINAYLPLKLYAVIQALTMLNCQYLTIFVVMSFAIGLGVHICLVLVPEWMNIYLTVDTKFSDGTTVKAGQRVVYTSTHHWNAPPFRAWVPVKWNWVKS